MFDRWPVDLIVVAIYLFHFHGSELGLKLGTSNPVQPEVVENEEEDEDDDWEGSMTSTELQSRQKALLRRWEPIMEERAERLEPSGWLFFARLLIMIYFFIHVFHIIECSKYPFSLPIGELLLFLAEYPSTSLIPLLLLIQLFIEIMETSHSSKKKPTIANSKTLNMPKYLVPSTPDTLPLYIARKLDALGSFPNEEGLDAIRILLYTYQEERVISDEELQEWKKMEKKILAKQNTYKENTETNEKYAKYDNENEDDEDDWEGPMTSTELQSRQKALVRKWETIMKERAKRRGSSDLFFFALPFFMFYFAIHFIQIFGCSTLRRSSWFPLPTGELLLLFAESISTLLIYGLLFLRFLVEG
ncbi:hypothetical protein CAEBREN_17743 [Caenorhabditis brenneri]|uniref:Uncharacterized protein n=1 Tax=Caenorhabditis brenneri TaxID=135651 RepID=G0MBV6_CAEBE|nr:hypothetical protein CAEBREN_17743 [Caenorhabditis brenneri]